MARNLYITEMALVGFSASAVQVLTYQNGYMRSLNKTASGAHSALYLMALGLIWDIVTGLP